MSEWRDLMLGDFVALQRGHDLTESERRVGHVPVMGSAGQNGFHDTALAKGPGVVIGRSGASFGQVHLSTSDYWPHNTALYVTDFKGNDALFAFYLLKTIDFSGYNSGSAQPSLNRNFIASIPLRIPPLAEQRAIAVILGRLDNKIELNRRMNATLEAMARALFQSWFVDFDPVRAKLDGRPPANLDPATAALFPASFQDSLLGPIPKGWTAQPLPDVIELNPRRALKNGVTAPYLDMKNLPTHGHCAEEVIDREFTSGTKFQNGDTLLARITPCLENGKTGFVDFLECGQVGWGSTEYIVFAPSAPIPPQYGYLLARSELLRSHAIHNMTGTSGRQRVPVECFNSFHLANFADSASLRSR
jgi:type I restriction enzyme S subunit